jgi:hypothetical protein
MTEQETEHARKVREYWTRAYDSLNNNKDRLQSEPTAVLTSQANTRKKIMLKDMLDFDLSR